MADTAIEVSANEIQAGNNDHKNAPGKPIAESVTATPDRLSQETEMPAGSKFLRGPLKYDVDTSSPQLEAGKAFSVFVRVTNPYESPVSLLDVSASLPAEFRDKENQDAGLLKTLKNQFKEELKSRVIVAQNVTAANSSESNSSVVTPGEILLQHGNSSLKRFTLKTWRSTLFMPAAYILQFQVQYKIDGVLNLDTIRKEFNIRAPLGAVLRGAIWGAIVGSVLHALYANQAGSTVGGPSLLPFLSQTLAGILLGGVLVVAFARKKDAQPFISIEDFYGGFFVGFSAGYIGKALLDKVLPK
jgi:hypothetical protein